MNYVHVLSQLAIVIGRIYLSANSDYSRNNYCFIRQYNINDFRKRSVRFIHNAIYKLIKCIRIEFVILSVSKRQSK